MRLDAILKRCERLEARRHALPRNAQPAPTQLCALWTALAREEEDHGRSIARARAHAGPTAARQTWIDGWEESLAEVEERLHVAEELEPGAPPARQLSAALDLEMTELEALRHVILAACEQPELDPPAGHAVHLAHAAERLSDDPEVRLRAAMLRARASLRDSRRTGT
jgi:hypothetical protein